LNVDEHLETEKKTKKSFSQVVMQIILINLVFSIDSIVTAIGLTESILIMFIAIITSMLIMVLVASGISKFVEEHPTVKMLALSFLLMIGCMLVIEAFEMHVPKGYIYFSMAFAFLVDIIQMKKIKHK
jgi:predicted tellurium resistance membrane protein TerC